MIDNLNKEKFVIEWKVSKDTWYLKTINLNQFTWGSLESAVKFSKTDAENILKYYKNDSIGVINMIEVKESYLSIENDK